jgi:tRNA1(Val) A37 N6-methylase TrmN6
MWFILTFPIIRVNSGGHEGYDGGHENPVSSKSDDFPYKKLTMKLKDLNERYNRLKSYKFDIVPHKYYIKNIRHDLLKYDGEQVVISHPKSYYDTYDNISDYFIEPARIRCIRSDQKESVYDYWVNHKNDIMKYCKSKYKKITTHNLRESVFDMIYECNTFKPSLIVGFIKMFKPKSILDISAGWGDRLIGAIASNVDYIGVDPADLHTEYKNIVEHFEHTSSTILMKGKFEEIKLKIYEVDMIFSSPPFFDLEKYSNDDSQSYMNKSLDEWFEKFLMVSIRKAWSFLKCDGHMILYMADAYNRKPYIQRMIDEINEFTDAMYLGCLPQMDLKQKIPRPFWIWQKKSTKSTKSTKIGGQFMTRMSGIIGL